MPKDWNNVSQSGQSSQDENYQQQIPTPKKQQSQVKDKQHGQTAGQKHQPVQQKKTHDQTRQRPKFLSDQELIQKLKSKEIEQRRKIKIVNCRSQELIQMINTHPLKPYIKQIKRDNNPSIYIAAFKTEQDLIAFIQEKIDNKYRFFLHPYVKSARDIQKQKQYEQKRKHRLQEQQRQKDRHNRYNNNRDQKRGDEREKGRGRNRPQYDDQQQQDYRKEPRRQKKYQPKNKEPLPQPKSSYERPKQQRVEKPISQPVVNNSSLNTSKPELKSQSSEFNYEIEKNQIKIRSNIYSKNRIVDEIVDRKISSKWDRIKIYVKRDGLNKVLELIELIYERIQYGLKVLPDQNTKEQYIEVVLQTKSHVIHPNAEYSLLTDNSKKYFDKVSSNNKYIIQKQFCVEEYLKGFKQNQKDICKKWNDWIIKAQGQNIPNLLKLSWKLRRQFYLNINIKVGKRSQVPFSILEIQPQSDKQKRPKPDASIVNNYLN